MTEYINVYVGKRGRQIASLLHDSRIEADMAAEANKSYGLKRTLVIRVRRWRSVTLNPPPQRVCVETCLEGEGETNICALVDDEWFEWTGDRRTTVTHHSFAAPTHWRPL